MRLKEKIEEYHNLKKMESQLQSRLKELNDQIKKDLVHPRYAKDESTFSLVEGQYEAEIKVKNYTSYNALELEDTLWKKGLWEKCSKRVIDDDAVEQAYFNGDLTDDDLRAVRDVKIVTSLKVGEPSTVQQ